MTKPKWKKTTLRLRKNHQWEGTPGCKVFVANRGDVRFEIPDSWLIIPGEDSIKFHNKQPPDDDVIVQLSVLHLPPDVDFTGYPVAKLLADVTGEGDRDVTWDGEIHRERRRNFELAWTALTFEDPNEHRPAHERSCLVRAGTVQASITMDYWPEDAARFEPVWDHLLRSLRMAEYIADIRTGARFGYG